jgi:hypothetical protein
VAEVVTVKTRVDAGFPERCTLYPPHYPPAVQTTRWFLVAPAADLVNTSVRHFLHEVIDLCPVARRAFDEIAGRRQCRACTGADLACSTVPTAAATMQCAHGYSGCVGVSMNGIHVARPFNVLWATRARNADEKSLDQEKPFYEYVAKRGQRCSGLRARPCYRGSKASSNNRDDQGYQADGQFLERWLDHFAPAQEGEAPLSARR